jgi:hypothetical protein
MTNAIDRIRNADGQQPGDAITAQACFAKGHAASSEYAFKRLK